MATFRPAPAAALLGLCVALGPAIGGFFIYKGILEAKRSDRYVTAKGLVERIEKADRGTWEVSFKVSGNNLAELYQQLSQNSEIIANFIKKEGFEETEISRGAPRVVDLHTREYGSSDNLPAERYLIELDMSVTSQKVDALSKLSAQTGQLINQSISLSRTGARFYLDKFNSLRPQLIAEATKNAQEVARGFAKTTNSKLGGIRKANQGTFTVTSPDASPNQDYDQGVESLMKKIRVVSTIEFYLE